MSPMLSRILTPTPTDNSNDKWMMLLALILWVLLWINAFDILALAE